MKKSQTMNEMYQEWIESKSGLKEITLYKYTYLRILLMNTHLESLMYR